MNTSTELVVDHLNLLRGVGVKVSYLAARYRCSRSQMYKLLRGEVRESRIVLRFLVDPLNAPLIHSWILQGLLVGQLHDIVAEAARKLEEVEPVLRDYIRLLLRELGLTQQAIAQLYNVSQSTVSRVVNGRTLNSKLFRHFVQTPENAELLNGLYQNEIAVLAH